MSQRRLTEEDVCKLAREIWESEGRPEGKSLEHWVRAEKILTSGNPNELHPDFRPKAAKKSRQQRAA